MENRKRISNGDLYLLIAGILFCILITYIGYVFLIKNDSFSRDVLSSFIRNLCGTGRFAAVPYSDICFMLLFYIHVLVYLCLKRKLKLNRNVFITVTTAIMVYIVAIAMLYMKKWAVQNIQLYDEYLTGFGKFMIIPTALVYLYWGYVIIISVIKNKKTNG